MAGRGLTIGGTVLSQKPDGTARVRTGGGEVTLKTDVRLTVGKPVSIQLPAPTAGGGPGRAMTAMLLGPSSPTNPTGSNPANAQAARPTPTPGGTLPTVPIVPPSPSYAAAAPPDLPLRPGTMVSALVAASTTKAQPQRYGAPPPLPLPTAPNPGTPNPGTPNPGAPSPGAHQAPSPTGLRPLTSIPATPNPISAPAASTPAQTSGNPAPPPTTVPAGDTPPVPASKGATPVAERSTPSLTNISPTTSGTTTSGTATSGTATSGAAAPRDGQAPPRLNTGAPPAPQAPITAIRLA